MQENKNFNNLDNIQKSKQKDFDRIKIEKSYKLLKILNLVSNDPVKVGLICIYIVFILSVLWACFASLDSASVSQGTVVLNNNQKIIQHFEGGIIEKIFVKEGDFVEAGQNLIFLNKISANSNLRLLYSEIISEKANEIRLISERDDCNYLNLNKLAYDNININDSIVKQIINTQTNLFYSRKNELFNKVLILENQIEQIKEEINGLESQKQSTKGQLLIAEKEAKIVEMLTQDGYETQIRLNILEKNIEELKGNIGNFVSVIAKSEQAINKLKLDIFNIKNERKNEVLQELHETQIKKNDLESRIMNAEDILDRVVIKTAYSGIVSDMKFYTVGGVIPPHMDIMTIIPQNDDLIVEAKLNPQDIDAVHIGLNAKVNLSAYKSRYIPALIGEVIYVAPDKITDSATKMSYYVIKIKIDNSNENNKAIITSKNIKLYPGMPAEVFVITGKRTFMLYLLDPIRKTFRKGFKEE